jgi:arginine decarboxylase
MTLSVSSPQAEMPLLAALQQCSQWPHAAFYAPGHKQGQGIAAELRKLLGDRVFQADLPELPELDNLFAPQGVIRKATNLAAAAFGAEQTWFLANGSTGGIEAAILATCCPGDTILLPRNCHQSVIAGLILAGARPVFLTPDYDANWDMAHGIAPATLASALAQHPDAKAVIILYPTYFGTCCNLDAIARLTHQYNIPLIVDEAHGPHFAFHPHLPPSALRAGADLVIQSTHKVLGAMTQAAMLHCQGNRIQRDRLTRALQLVQSTSPSYLLLASLDAARHQMAIHGQELMQRTLELAALTRQRLQAIPGLRVLAPDHAGHSPGFQHLDSTRLTIDVTGLGLTGFEADEQLQALGVMAELPTLRHLTFIISLGNTTADTEKLVHGFQTLSHHPPLTIHRPPPTTHHPPSTTHYLPSPLTPRAAFFAATETVPLEQARDRISAELICPYPPGIPLVVPGEPITQAAIEQLQWVLQAGGMVTGCADASGQTLKVVV